MIIGIGVPWCVGMLSGRRLCDDGLLEGFGVDVWLVDYDDGSMIEMTAYSKASMWGGDNLEVG